MKNMKLFSKILGLVTATSMLSVPVYADDIEVSNAPAPYVNEDYAITSEGADYTFKELLEMDAEEFMELDKYKGTQSAETRSWYTGYKNICFILNTTYFDIEDFVKLNHVDMNVEEISKNLLENKNIKIDNYDFKVVIPFYTDANYSEEGIMDSKCIAITELTNKFYINASTDFLHGEENGMAEYNQEIDTVWLAKQLNEYFGDEIEFKCYEELNYLAEYKPTGRICVEFDMDDELSMDNVLYHAKVLACLSKINYDISAVKDYNGSASEQVELNEIFDSTVKVGDADGDSAVTVRDCAEISIKLSKSDSNLSKWVDFNLDQKVNVRDAASIARYLANK